MLKVTETFYSVQGEGACVGIPMYFIRLSGCNKKCDFCDTKHKEFTEISEAEIVAKSLLIGTDIVCITGGEPNIQDWSVLSQLLHEAGLRVHVETNGSLPMRGVADWITVSPKDVKLDESTATAANEYKFLCGLPDWAGLITQVREQYGDADVLCLQPVWGPRTLEYNRIAVSYVKTHPEFRLSVQLHKYLGVM